MPAFMCKQKSYSQCGEDLIVLYVLNMLLGGRPKRYLDVGANHPFHLSNTALLYTKGGYGTLVEPDPLLARQLKKKRPGDRVLQYGVHFSGEKKAEFFMMDSPTLNTFSREEMLRYISMGHKLIKSIPIELIDINDLLEITGPLDFMSLDIEGLDFSILKMINWEKHRPTCVCVETLTYETNDEPIKRSEIARLMDSCGYFLFADTFINSIFIDIGCWQLHWARSHPSMQFDH